MCDIIPSSQSKGLSNGMTNRIWSVLTYGACTKGFGNHVALVVLGVNLLN